MKFLVVLLGLFVAVEMADDVPSLFRKHELVPDISKEPPNDLLLVKYEDKPISQMGEEFTPTQVKNAPSVQWNAEASSYYTLVMTDPDAPSRTDPKFREVMHWKVVNIPGSNLSEGETLAGYRGSGPPKDTGLHRYAFLVYKQPGKLDFSSESRIESSSREGRLNFSVQKFADKYNLGTPIAGNMFQAQFEEK